MRGCGLARPPPPPVPASRQAKRCPAVHRDASRIMCCLRHAPFHSKVWRVCMLAPLLLLAWQKWTCSAKYFESPSSSVAPSEAEVEVEVTFVGKRTRNGAARKGSAKKCDAPWQKMLDMNDASMNSIHDERSRDGKHFRRRFRMPYSLFKSLIQVMLDEQWFPRYGSKGEGPLDCTKTRGASLQVKVLSVFFTDPWSRCCF